ncbi:MAG: TonB-dependent receptor [Flavobacteriales bacterium]
MRTLISTRFIFLSFYSFSQEATISGIVQDDGGKPMEFVNIILQQASDSIMVKAASTDEKGGFTLEGMSSGNYFLLIRQVGFADQTTAVFAFDGKTSIKIPVVKMTTGSNELEALEVVFVKPLVEVKADKTIFNVEGTTNATGLNALEVLRKAPGVMIDNNENIMVKGKGGIVVYIDGKRTPLDGDALKDMLKNMQSSNIESIEIITNPSAKYDAAGNAGIINIKLKKNKNYGTNGTVTLGYATQRYSKYNTSLTLNHRKNKWNLYGTYGNNWGQYWNFMYFDRTQNQTRFDQESNNVSDGFKNNFKAGADYFLNDKSTFGVMVSGNMGNNGWNSDSRTEITSALDPSSDRLLVSETTNNGRRDNITANLNYHFADTSGHDLNLDVDYGNYAMYNNSYQPNRYLDLNENFMLYENNFRNNTRTDIRLYTAKGDYEQNLFKGRLGAGFKSSYVETDNKLDFYNVINNEDFIDSTRSNLFQYRENINAVYANYNQKIKKFSIQLGLRAEQTVSKGTLESQTSQDYEEIDRNYINLFPSAALTYEVNEKNNLNLTYSRRIDRPSYDNLNPFEYRLDELTYSKGNVNLKPQLTHAFELTHTFMYMMNTSLGYSRTDNFFTEITDTTEVNRSYISPRNLGFQEYYSINIGSPIPIAKWLQTYVNLTGYWVHNRADFGEGKVIDLRATSYSIYMSNTITVNKKLNFEVSGWYGGPGIWGGTFQNDPMWSLDLGAKLSVMKDRGTLKLAYGDIFWKSQWRGVSEFGGLYMVARGGWESRQFRATFSFNFGNQNLKSRVRKTGAEDINKRVG